MPRQRNTFVLGLVVTGFFALFLGVTVFLARGLGVGREPFVVRFPADELTARFQVGDEVICGGQTVGTVRRIEFRDEAGPDGSDRLWVYVTADVRRDIDLRKDCVVQPSAPLLGEISKLIIRRRGTGPPVDPTVPIDGQPAYRLDDAIDSLARELDPERKGSLLARVRSQLDEQNAGSLISKIHLSLDDLNQVTRNVSLQLNPAQRHALLSKLHAVLDNVNSATGFFREQLEPGRNEVVLAKVHAALDSLNQALGTVVAMLEENRAPVGETVAHVRNTARTIDEQIAARIAEQLDARDAASLIAKVHVGIDRMNRSLEDLNRITGTGRQLVLSNREVIERVFANLKETSDHLKAASKEIYRNPWRLLYKPTDRQSRELNVFDAAREFAEAATQLDSAMIRLQGVMEASDGLPHRDDRTLVEIRDALQHSVERFKEAEQALWRQLDLR